MGLLMYKLYSYIVIKPTSLHRSETLLTYNLFHKILFCPEPAFDLDQMTLMGYAGAFEFYFGNFSNAETSDRYKGKVFGWSGKYNMSQSQVKKELFPQNTTNGFVSWAYISTRNDIGHINDFVLDKSFNFKSVAYPGGKCLRIDH